MRRVIVVGGGIWGLSLAYRLQQQAADVEVVVLEAQARPGGKVDTLVRDGFVLEAGPNGFLDNNPATIELARAVGLEDHLVPASASAGKNRFLFLDGRLRMLPNSLGTFLTTDLLSWIGKLELLTERFRPARRSLADESIDAFARRRAGREVAGTFADAFVTGILAGDPRLLSIQAAFPRLANWEREHGSVMRGLAATRRAQGGGPRRATMWSIRGGLRVLIEALTAQLRNPPVLGVGVRRVWPEAGGWRVQAEGRDAWTADAVVLACPARQQAELLADLDADLAQRIAGIAYNRIAVVGLGYAREEVPHGLDGFGYLSPQKTRRDVLGVQWCSSIYPGQRAPQGAVLLRALCGGWHRGDLVEWPDDRLVGAVRGELATSLDVRAGPIFHQVVRWSPAIPQYFVGHGDRVAWIEARAAAHPGLFLGGSAYRGVALNDCIEQAGLLARRVAAFFS